MNIIFNQDAVSLAAYQAVLAVVGVLVFLWLTWRAARAVIARAHASAPLTQRDVLAAAWPSLAWVAVMIAVGIVFTTMQAYGPRVALPPTKLEANKQDVGDGVRDLSPKMLTDAERLAEQRRLEVETKSRVGLE
ncbi:MAG: hypothetical protein ACR2PA_20500 [Hyphomicrobiaceae bacterium]